MIETINNSATMTGVYDSGVLNLTSTIAETQIVEGLTATKTASKALWAGGTMTYTIVVDNQTQIVFENAVFSDTLDSRLTLVENSVKINGQTSVYTYSGNVLTINLGNIGAESDVTVTFDVEMAD